MSQCDSCQSCSLTLNASWKNVRKNTDLDCSAIALAVVAPLSFTCSDLASLDQRSRNILLINKKRQVNLDAFFATHSVFIVEQIATFLRPTVGPATVTARLNYYSRIGCIRSIVQLIYAVVPHGLSANKALRPQASLAFKLDCDIVNLSTALGQTHI